VQRTSKILFLGVAIGLKGIVLRKFAMLLLVLLESSTLFIPFLFHPCFKILSFACQTVNYCNHATVSVEDVFHSNLYTVEKFAPFSYKILYVLLNY
jgi:hypothetical protein